MAIHSVPSLSSLIKYQLQKPVIQTVISGVAQPLGRNCAIVALINASAVIRGLDDSSPCKLISL